MTAEIIDAEHAEGFVRKWEAAWNRRDLEAVLELFSDDAVFTSELALRMQPETGGRLRGKTELRSYWSEALAAVPTLRFDVNCVFTGVDWLAVHFTLNGSAERVELLRLQNGLVVEGHGLARRA